MESRHSHATTDETWFAVEITLLSGPAFPANVLHVREVARRTGRSESAVRQARLRGLIPSPPFSPTLLRGRHPQAFVIATESDLERWTVQPLSEVLSSRPDLPNDELGWLSTSEVARTLCVTYNRAARLIRRIRPTRIEWGSHPPFRGEICYWLPDIALHKI